MDKLQGAQSAKARKQRRGSEVRFRPWARPPFAGTQHWQAIPFDGLHTQLTSTGRLLLLLLMMMMVVVLATLIFRMLLAHLLLPVPLLLLSPAGMLTLQLNKPLPPFPGPSSVAARPLPTSCPPAAVHTQRTQACAERHYALRAPQAGHRAVHLACACPGWHEASPIPCSSLAPAPTCASQLRARTQQHAPRQRQAAQAAAAGGCPSGCHIAALQAQGAQPPGQPSMQVHHGQCRQGASHVMLACRLPGKVAHCAAAVAAAAAVA